MALCREDFDEAMHARVRAGWESLSTKDLFAQRAAIDAADAVEPLNPRIRALLRSVQARLRADLDFILNQRALSARSGTASNL